jgi:hypothetical protein
MGEIHKDDLAAIPLFKVGARVRLRQRMIVFNLGDLPDHADGTVVSVTPDAEEFARVRLDHRVADLDEWDNELQVFLHDSEVTPCAFEASPMVARLAEVFTARLKAEMTPSEWAEMCKRNATADSLTCHSHDFLDANMIMADAWRYAVGADFLPDDDSEPSQSSVDLWNAAWDHAKSSGMVSD